MKLTEFTTSYERTVQLDRFEPVRISESVTVQIEDDDDLDVIRGELDSLLRKSVEKRILRRVMEKKMAEGNTEDPDPAEQ